MLSSPCEGLETSEYVMGSLIFGPNWNGLANSVLSQNFQTSSPTSHVYKNVFQLTTYPVQMHEIVVLSLKEK